MLKKVLEYAGDYRKKTYQAIATMLIGVGMNILPFLFIYQIIIQINRSLFDGVCYQIFEHATPLDTCP